MSEQKQTYLGDAVYASFDGYMIKLSANDGEQVIYLEPDVYEAYKKYAETVWNTAS